MHEPEAELDLDERRGKRRDLRGVLARERACQRVLRPFNPDRRVHRHSALIRAWKESGKRSAAWAKGVHEKKLSSGFGKVATHFFAIQGC